MFYVYILKSAKDSELYIGSTKDWKDRVSKHNAGKVFSTKNRRPFALVYYEAYRDEGEARLREKRLKLRGQARRRLFDRIEKSLCYKF